MIEISIVQHQFKSFFYILKSLNLRADDMVICTSHTYRAVRNAVDDCITRHNADVLCLDMPKDITDEDQVIQK